MKPTPLRTKVAAALLALIASGAVLGGTARGITAGTAVTEALVALDRVVVSAPKSLIRGS